MQRCMYADAALTALAGVSYDVGADGERDTVLGG